MKSASFFTRTCKGVSEFSGRPLGVGLALGAVLLWAALGPSFHFSDNWQSLINTGTQLVTFMMVFLIQGSQNRDTDAIQVKLDELIRATDGAHNAILDLEELEPEDIAGFRKIYNDLAKKARDSRDAEDLKDGTPEINVEKVAGT